MKEIGIYIHIPFCKRKCFYCDFCSFECDKSIHENYTKALIDEIRAFNVDINEDIIIKTLYIGGGTPSYINPKYIEQIVYELKQKYKFDENVEATIEVNPGTATYDSLSKYKEIGINRISIGLQSTNDRLLNLIGRIHKYKDFEDTYTTVRKLGFNNVNVDLMVGLPTQTVEDVEESLEKIIEKNPEHISVYSLILEDDTKLKDLVESNKLKLPDEDIERQMYWLVKRKLEENKYEHYEISNFAKEGFQSRHNTDCWRQKEYIAFGLAAHSYFNSVRYSNTTDLNEYMYGLNAKKNIEEIQNYKTKMNEFVLLGLRMIKGFSLNDFEQKFQKRFENEYKLEMEKLLNMGLLQVKDGRALLTNRGMDFANIVWSEFV